ncbi:MAG: hypothetical protein ACLFUO_04205 [Candidatus Woesearchaeota archaeon]
MAKDDLDTRDLRDALSGLKTQIQNLEKSFSGRDVDVREKIEHAKQRAMETKKEMEHKVQEHPLPSVGISFGVGMLAGIVASAIMMHKK